MSKAIFLDRDGVINEPVFRKERNEYEPPHNITEIKIYAGVAEALSMLQKSGYKLFLITNQPDHAKGKTSLENLNGVKDHMHKYFTDNGIEFTEYFYCFHHPEGVVPEYSIKCECRKPGTLFTKQAISQYGIDVNNSWLIGDRDKDIECGIKSGLKTIRIRNKINTVNIKADLEADSLLKAAELILQK